MVDDHNPEYIESKPLNTEIATLAPEAADGTADLSNDSTPIHLDASTPAVPAPSSQTTPSEKPASGHIAPSLSENTEEPEQD